MRISVFGLGYVGTVSAACLARDHTVVGVDPNETKVQLINDGKAPIVEKGLGDLVASARSRNALAATTSAADAVRDTELSLVCVGTPSRANGSLELDFLERVAREIGAALAQKQERHIVVIRSTVLPGTMAGTVIPALEQASGKRAGADFGVCSNPEFLRESTAVYDYDNPPKTVIGSSDDTSAAALRSLYDMLDAPLIVTTIQNAEMVKYVDNVWHALKVNFANEIGNICKAVGLDSHEVMDIFCRDEKLNLSPYYLKPGFAFGGSCLPKDVRALTYHARSLDVEVPVLNSLIRSNELQIERGIEMVMARPGKKLGVLGFSFKAGTDDLRESPLVILIERLLGKGYDIRLYDKNVSLARLTGANREYIEHHIPHLARLMVDSIGEVIEHAETIVVGNGSEEFRSIRDRTKDTQAVIDLIRIDGKARTDGSYEGICW